MLRSYRMSLDPGSFTLQSIEVDVARALDQIAEIHRQMAKGEVYRGYRSLPLAASGLMGIAAAWLQPATLGTADPIGFVLYWTVIAAGAGFVGARAINFSHVREVGSTRAQTRRVGGQFLPSLVCGAGNSLCVSTLVASPVPR